MQISDRWDHSELDAVLSEPTPQKRGAAFQDYVLRLLRRERFAVELYARGGNSRQVDLFAIRGDEHFLIECKLHAKPSGRPAVDDLWVRLSTAQPSVVGVLVSGTGFAATAISRVEQYPDKRIILVDENDLRQAEYSHTLYQLLRRKLNHLTVHGQALVGARVHKSATIAGSDAAPTRGKHAFVLADQSRTQILEVVGGFGQTTFCQGFPDIDWGYVDGRGASLELALGGSDQDGLIEVFSKLQGRGWTSEQGSWRIAQAGVSWVGFGLAALIEALRGWRDRYAGRILHHSEQITYFDAAADGFYILTAQISAEETRQVSYFDLAFRLPGIPVDQGPLRTLLDGLELDYSPFFRTLTRQAVNREHTNRRLQGRTIKPIALIVNDPPELVEQSEPGITDEWVTGAVLPNPIGKQGWKSNQEAVADLGRTSRVLVCSLGSWHYLSETREYYIRFTDTATCGYGTAVRVHIDWPD